MNTSDGQRPGATEVRTVLQYLARSNRQLLLFYGSAFTVGVTANRPIVVYAALIFAGLPHLLMIALSVVDRDAIKALGSDYGAHQLAQKQAAYGVADSDDGDATHNLQIGPGNFTLSGPGDTTLTVPCASADHEVGRVDPSVGATDLGGRRDRAAPPSG